MSRFSSFKEHQLITESWREYAKEGASIEEATPISPLSATKPGERIVAPGSQRPLESRDIGGNVDAIAAALTDVDEAFEALTAVVVTPGAPGVRSAPPELWKLRNAIAAVSNRFASLQNRVGEDPRAPRLEEE